MRKSIRPFHAAYPITDIEKTREFYTNILGCTEGRSESNWVDFNFFGHQVVFHLDKTYKHAKITNIVDSEIVPVPHFGVVLEWNDWEDIVDKLKVANTVFLIEPYIRFKGKPGEQGTCFFQDPNGLNLEFKAFREDSMIFAT